MKCSWRTRTSLLAASMAILATAACGGGDGGSKATSPGEDDSGGHHSVVTGATAPLVEITPAASATALEGTPAAEESATVAASVTPEAAASVAAGPVTAPVQPVAPASTSHGLVSRMRIPSLGVNYPIEVLGLTSGNELDTPHNATGAIGWYSVPTYPALAVPGSGGAAMFSAHVNYNGSNGPFANLANIQGGAEIAIVMADGSEYKYQVFSVRGYVINASYADGSRAVIDMVNLVYTPGRSAGDEWITLMTCSCGPGRIINQDAHGFGDCVDRDVVIARRVS